MATTPALAPVSRRISQTEARYMLARLQEISKAYYDGKFERSHLTLIKIGRLAEDGIAVGSGHARGEK